MGHALITLIMIPVGSLFFTGVLWWVAKIMGEEIGFKYLFLSSVIAAIIYLFFPKIPFVGYIIATIVQIYLLSRWVPIGLLKSFLIILISDILMVIIIFILLTVLSSLPIFHGGPIGK